MLVEVLHCHTGAGLTISLQSPSTKAVRLQRKPQLLMTPNPPIRLLGLPFKLKNHLPPGHQHESPVGLLRVAGVVKAATNTLETKSTAKGTIHRIPHSATRGQDGILPMAMVMVTEGRTEST